MALRLTSATTLFDAHLAGASRGDGNAYFELGMAYSTGGDGIDVDLVEAHKWFNLAALAGVREGGQLRAEIAADMSRDDIAEAQRQARAWLSSLAAPADQRHVA